MSGIKGFILSVMVVAGLQAFPVMAAQQPMFFKHLSLQDGLSQNTVMSILQDSQGFIWLGTENGLNRYDGYSIKRYLRDRETTKGLASDFIRSIVEDSNKDLWLATDGGGVARWNRQTDTFDVFRHDPEDLNSLASDSARAVVAGSDGRIWIGFGNAGLDMLDPVTGEVMHYRHDVEDRRSLSSDTVYALLVDRVGHLWVGTDAGLNRFNPNSGNFTRYNYNSDDPYSLSSDRVRSLYEGRQGSLWVGTLGGGLNRFLRSSGRFTHYRHNPSDAKSLSDDNVRAIFEDDTNRLWVGTSNGLNLFNRQSMSFSTYHHDRRPGSLSENYVMSIHQDRGGLLWVGTRASGVNVWNPRSWSLGHYSADWLDDTNVTSFSSEENTLWVGTLDHGVTQLQDGVVVNTYRAPDLTEDRVMSLLLDRQRRLWVGTMAGGLNRLDLATGEIVQYRHDKQNLHSLGSDGVMSLHEDRAGVVWVGTFGGGINRYDPNSDGFTRYETDPELPNGLTSPRATAIVDDLDGFIWVGTDNGLNRLDPTTGTIIQIRHDPEDPTSLGANKVYALHVDNAGTLWVGTAGGGLSQLLESGAPQQHQFKNYSQSQGLPSNVVYSVYSDAQGQLWLSTNNGIARRDPSTGTFKTFHKAHGLQGNEFNFGAHHENSQGVLFFGGANGFNAISPSKLKESSNPPQLVLTNIETLNQPALTTLPPSQVREIEISHKDKLLTFEFSALDFTSPAQNQYQYVLEGFDSTWTSPGPSRRATYTNLDPGSYVFRVKAANSDGVWNEEGIAVSVNVLPAPWQTLWAYAAYALAVIIFLAILARLQWLKQLREKQYQDRLYKLAYIDTLTGVPNRHLFIKHLKEAIDEAESENEKIALLYIDLGHFKRINETLGHRAGDAILKLVTKRLTEVMSEISSYAELNLARIGGHEFVVTISKFGDQARIIHLAERILDALSKPFHHERYELVVTPSIGVSVFPQDGKDVSSLLKNADTAMYEAKTSGRNDYKTYSPTMNAKALENLALEKDLRHALEEDQLNIVYQPKVDLRTMKVVSAEALLRWTHPERGDVSPARFISIAEQSGLILDIDSWVTSTVCNQLSAWQHSGVKIVPVAINLSGYEFARGDELIAMLINSLGKADIDPHYLQLEITEGVLMNDADAARALLARLKVIGFDVAIDDFGTGYSSLSYLKGFSLAALKIDRSFVVDVEDNSADQAICSAIISMTHGLGLHVIAEGVETPAQLDFLRKEGCDLIQGYLVGKPASADEFPALLSNSDGVNFVLAQSSRNKRLESGNRLQGV